jgi:hypothetical protein
MYIYTKILVKKNVFISNKHYFYSFESSVHSCAAVCLIFIADTLMSTSGFVSQCPLNAAYLG